MDKPPEAFEALDAVGAEHARRHQRDLDPLIAQHRDDLAQVLLVLLQRLCALAGIRHVIRAEHDAAEIRLFVQHIGLNACETVSGKVAADACIEYRKVLAIRLPDAVSQQLVIHQLRLLNGLLVAVGKFKFSMGHAVSEKAQRRVLSVQDLLRNF